MEAVTGLGQKGPPPSLALLPHPPSLRPRATALAADRPSRGPADLRVPGALGPRGATRRQDRRPTTVRTLSHDSCPPLLRSCPRPAPRPATAYDVKTQASGSAGRSSVHAGLPSTHRALWPSADWPSEASDRRHHTWAAPRSSGTASLGQTLTGPGDTCAGTEETTLPFQSCRRNYYVSLVTNPWQNPTSSLASRCCDPINLQNPRNTLGDRLDIREST